MTPIQHKPRPFDRRGILAELDGVGGSVGWLERSEAGVDGDGAGHGGRGPERDWVSLLVLSVVAGG